MTTVIGSYSEAGGVGKTTHAVSLAATVAATGADVLLVDLDPRAAATMWLNVEPKEPGLDVSAIIGNEDPDGWADDLAVPAPADAGWPSTLRVLPSGRALSTLEAQQVPGVEFRLMRALDGTRADLVVIDCPNRQGGPLMLSALTACDGMVLAARPDSDGTEGVAGAQRTIDRHNANMRRIGSPRLVDVLGILVGAAQDNIVPRVERVALDELADAYGDRLIRPFIPRRTIVRECRYRQDWIRPSDPGSDAILSAYTAAAEAVGIITKEDT